MAKRQNGKRLYIDTDKIETKGVNAVDDFFEDSEVVTAYLKKHDKGPIWDGSLYLYAEGIKDNLHFTGRVAVQIKGKQQKIFRTKDFTYRIGMVELKAYLKEGVAYFVVQQVGRMKKIFYHLLTPVDIRCMINSNQDNKSVAVPMKPICDDDLGRIERELLVFEMDCKRQTSYAESKPVDFSDLFKEGMHSFTVSVSTKSMDQNLLLALTGQPVYVYGNMGYDVQVPLGNGKAWLTLANDVNMPVKVKDKTYYEGYHSKMDREYVTITVGECFEMKFLRDEENFTGRINVNVSRKSKKLKDVIREAEFIMALEREHEVTIGEKTFPIPDVKDKMTPFLNKHLGAWIEIDRMLEKVGANLDLDLTKMTKKDSTTLSVLVEAIWRDHEVDVKDVTLGVNNIKVANLNLWFIISKIEDKRFVIRSFFDERWDIKATYDYSDGTFNECLCSWFDKKKLLECDNFPYSDVVSGFDKLVGKNPHVFERANMLLLGIIAAYDETDDENPKNKLMYDAALALVKWLIVTDKKDDWQAAYKLNYYQLLKRRPGLTDDDRKELKLLQLESNGNALLQCGVSLLLDDKVTFEYCWNKLPKEEQEEFQGYPIYRFRNSLK